MRSVKTSSTFRSLKSLSLGPASHRGPFSELSVLQTEEARLCQEDVKRSHIHQSLLNEQACCLIFLSACAVSSHTKTKQKTKKRRSSRK